MKAASIAGVVYFAVVFSAGFALGLIRSLLLVPRIGSTAAVGIELPIMLALSWFVCGWTIERFSVPGAWSIRIAMGAVSFALLMAAEFILSRCMFGRPLAAHFATYGTWAGILGLAGQIAFALLPLLRRN
jgi:hypothetical protein